MGKIWDILFFDFLIDAIFLLLEFMRLVMMTVKMMTSFLKISQDFDLKVLKLRPRICYKGKKIFFVSKSCCQCVKKSKFEKYLKKKENYAKNEERMIKKFYEIFQW